MQIRRLSKKERDSYTENRKKCSQEELNDILSFSSDIYTGNFKNIFDSICGEDNKNTLSYKSVCSAFIAYYHCLEWLISDYTEGLYDLSTGIDGEIFQHYELTTEDGVPITTNSEHDDIFNAFDYRFQLNKNNLDNYFLSYINTDNNEKVKIDVFPDYTNTEDKKILNILANKYLISCVLQENNKYLMTLKKNTPNIIKTIIDNVRVTDENVHDEDKWDMTKKQVLLFLNSYIDIDFSDKKIKNNIDRYIHAIYYNIYKM